MMSARGPAGRLSECPSLRAERTPLRNSPIRRQAYYDHLLRLDELRPKAVYRHIEVLGNTPRRRNVLLPVTYRTGRVFVIAVGGDEYFSVGDGRWHELSEQAHAVGAE